MAISTDLSWSVFLESSRLCDWKSLSSRMRLFQRNRAYGKGYSRSRKNLIIFAFSNTICYSWSININQEYMSMYTFHEDEALRHAYYSPENRAEPTKFQPWLSLIRLLKWLRPRQTADVGMTVWITEKRVSRLLQWIQASTESKERVPKWFEEVVEVLKKYNFQYILSRNGISILYGRLSDINLHITYDERKNIYIEHYLQHKLVYKSIYDLMERIEGHDYDIMSLRNGGFQRRSFTEGIPRNVPWVSGAIGNDSGQVLPVPEGEIQQTVQFWTTEEVTLAAKSTVNEIVSMPSSVAGAFRQILKAIGTKLPYDIRWNTFFIRYFENDRSKDIAIRYDVNRRVYRVKGNDYSTLSSLLVFLIDDFNNLVDNNARLKWRIGRLRLGDSRDTIESWFDSRTVSSKPWTDWMRQLPPSRLNIREILIPDRTNVVHDFMQSQFNGTSSSIEVSWIDGVENAQIKAYIASLSQTQRERYPDQYQVVRWDLDWVLHGTAILIQAMMATITQPLPVYTRGSTDHLEKVAAIQAYVSLRQTLSDETFNAIWWYFDMTDILSFDQVVVDALENVSIYILQNEAQDVDKGLEWAMVKSKIIQDLRSLRENELILRDKLRHEVSTIRSPHTSQHVIDAWSPLMKMHPNRVRLLDSGRNI